MAGELVPLLVRRDQLPRIRRAIMRALRPIRGSRGLWVEDRDDTVLIVGPPPSRGGGGGGAGAVEFCSIESYDDQTHLYTVTNQVSGAELEVENISELLHTGGGPVYLQCHGILADAGYYLHDLYYPLYRTTGGKWFLASAPVGFVQYVI